MWIEVIVKVKNNSGARSRVGVGVRAGVYEELKLL